MSSSLLELAWTRLSKGLKNVAICDEWKTHICEMYGKPQRYYHTLHHVEEMLQLGEQYKDLLRDRASVDYAIIFHDVVYQPKAPDNEEQSALLFKHFSKEVGLSTSVEESVVRMIQATKFHKTPAHDCEVPGSLDLHYMLDFDMAVLGRPQQGYQTYAQQIRQEYIHIPKETYCQKRAEVLASFLKIPYIYATKEFRLRFENQARKNIEEEIDFLRKEVPIS